MKTEEAPVTSPTINMTLKEETIGIEEVVAIGYGVVKKRDLTGSVASVTGEKLAENPVSNVVQAMQGRLSGVNVISQDGGRVQPCLCAYVAVDRLLNRTSLFTLLMVCS
jgi:outer membrane receptor protein involved in Fe transport